MSSHKKLIPIIIFALLAIEVSYTPHLQSYLAPTAIAAVVTEVSTCALTCLGFLAAKFSGVCDRDPRMLHKALDASLSIAHSNLKTSCTASPINSQASTKKDVCAKRTKPITHTHAAPVKATATPKAIAEILLAHRHIAQTTLGKITNAFTQTNASTKKTSYNQWAAQQAAHTAPHCEVFYTENQIRIQSPEHGGFITFGAKNIPPESIIAATEKNMQEAIKEKLYPGYKKYVQHRWFNDINALLTINSENPIARVRAALNLRRLESNDMPYGHALCRAKHDLLKHLYLKDGKLCWYIVQRRTSEIHRYAKRFIGECVQDKQQYKQLIEQLPESSGLYGSERKIAMPPDLHCRALNHPMNKVYENLLDAGDAYDMQTVAQIKEQYSQDQTVQAVARQYQIDYRQKIYNEHGIVRVGLNDPLYTKTDKQKLAEIHTHSTLRDALNQELLVRHGVKTTLQERWEISEYAPQCVHNALYTLLENGGKSLSHITELQQAIENIVANAKSSDYTPLMNAFYEPSGILKEIAHQIPSTQHLHLPPEILSPEHAATRHQLNTFMRLRESDTAAKPYAQQGINEIERFFVAQSAQAQAQHKTLFDQAYTDALSPDAATAHCNEQATQQKTQNQPQVNTEINNSMPMPPGPELDPEKKVKTENKTISLADYDSSLGDLKKLEEAANMFKDNPSAITKEGPLTKLLENGKVEKSTGNLGTARGAAYELEKAYDLAKAGEKTIEFGNKQPLISAQTGSIIKRLDVDIETSSKLIECKNIDWIRNSPETMHKIFENIKSKTIELRKMASNKGKTFEFHSKYQIPETLRIWFQTKNITFFEG
ncbi:hypothetical protein [Methylicorpusculum sp.]|uniref:hypothetical protein n=1 Tax=Methylicorpusculum sp. TaxID=2713644 RepID=UPI002ABD1157|nr:hypothetical protein [Methylicorpusculum sp.]MDZ4154632.1 hypothetical protein [Methylicorpusculum sp.]